MAIFPRIQSPCPYKGELSSLMVGDVCRACKRQVIDITAWSDDKRVAFLSSCTEKVCVSYKMPVLAAVVVATMAVPTAAAACEPIEIFVGGIEDPTSVEYVRNPVADRAIPVLPVVYEDEEDGTAQAAADAHATS